MDYSNLTNEQMEQVRACKTTEDLMNLIQAEGMELTDEQLEAVAGGGTSAWDEATGCGDFGTIPCDPYGIGEGDHFSVHN